MNINDINITQAMQNAIRPAEKSNVPVQARTNISPSAASAQFTGETQASQVPARGLVVSIDFIKTQLDNILVNYPPFFPLGTFQRLDLIKKVKGVEEQIAKSSVDEGLKKVFSGEKLSVDATDKDISVALDRLFQFRDTIAQDKSVTAEQLQPGAILDIKV
ncbi:MAG: hypothetical protein HZB31_15280 [Nitrospirae bacterium]|nr:hypothetical protein [Nitrospirota bacterium]